MFVARMHQRDGRDQDVDAIVATGGSHEVYAVNVLTRLLAQSPPAAPARVLTKW